MTQTKVHIGGGGRDSRLWTVVGAITALGLGLRILAGQGALWLDEAWSATAAADVGTPLGVFLQVNHDNNHHLNTLWLQLVGLDAPPLLQRALSIVTGAAAIPVAAAIAARQGKAAALVAALLFAVSPLLVTYGAEARGYAPMVLALLVTVLLVASWLDDTAKRVPAIPIALAVLLGMFSQLTMAFGLAALGLFMCWILFRSLPPGEALKAAARILLPAMIPAILALGVVLGAAHGTGLRFGNFEPFSLWSLGEGIGAMLLASFGGPIALITGLVLMAPPDTPAERDGPVRDRIFFVLALLIPLGVALAQLGNSGAPRYHLLSGVGALMLVAMHSGPRLAFDRSSQLPVAIALGLVVIASLITDWRIIENRRADPGVAMDAMAAAAPAGTDISVERDRSSAIFRAAGASRHYPVTVIEAPCPAGRFLYIDRDGDDRFPDSATRCGAKYRLVTEGHPTGLSGTHWRLYERVSAPVTAR